MDGRKCILQLRGVRPFLRQVRSNETSELQIPFRLDKKNAFDVERYMSTRPKVKPDEAFDIYEIDLSNEDAACRDTGGIFIFNNIFLSRKAAESEVYMDFLTAQLVYCRLWLALGAGLGIWGLSISWRDTATTIRGKCSCVIKKHTRD